MKPWMSPSLVALFACACGASVANVYFAQPLLDMIAADLSMSHSSIGGLITATQCGSALALLFLVPLGDRMDRRKLMLLQLIALTVSLLCVCLTTQAFLVLLAMLAVGMLGTAMTQGLISYAAAASEPSERGRVVGAAQGGVVIGLLLARVVAGSIADMTGWRSVYAVSAITMIVMGCMLWCFLPGLPVSSNPPSYGGLIKSMFHLLGKNRVLQIRGLIALMMFMTFSIFWTALVFPLSTAPYEFSHATIGAFGLIGVIGVIGAARAGRWFDRGAGQLATFGALALLAFSWLPLSYTSVSIWALVAGILLLDLAVQALQVTNQSMVLQACPELHSRLIACYMLFYAVGSGTGAIAATKIYDVAGWAGVCSLGVTVSLFALAFWATTLRHMPGSCAKTVVCRSL